LIAWLVFYEAKQAAFAKLLGVLPQVSEVEDFWRYVQNMPPVAWRGRLIEGEVASITKSRCLCARCQKVKVSWPEPVVNSEGVLARGRIRYIYPPKNKQKPR
jgi:hypothetical protein